MSLWNSIFIQCLGEFPRNETPLKIDVLRVFFNYTRNCKLPVSTAARKTAVRLVVHWHRLGRKTISWQAVSSKIQGLYKVWSSLLASASRGGDTFETQLENFKWNIKDVLDIGIPDTTPPSRAQKREAELLAYGYAKNCKWRKCSDDKGKRSTRKIITFAKYVKNENVRKYYIPKRAILF